MKKVKGKLLFLTHNPILKFKKGFTLLEVLLAIFVITIGVVGVSLAIQQAVSFTAFSTSKLTAIYLAQEGIEVVRNIRDTNWLEERTNPGISWDDGLSPGEYEADYKSQSLVPYSDRYLKLPDGGFYNYDSGKDTKFKRKITISKVGEAIEVSVKVSWLEKGNNYKVTAQEDLYNWR